MKILLIANLFFALTSQVRAQAIDFSAIVEQAVREFRAVPAVILKFAGQVVPPLIAPGAWEKMSPPSPEMLTWLSKRVAGLDAVMVRQLPQAAALSMIDDAVGRKFSVLDVFTDSALREKKIYYISQASLAEIDKHYELSSLFPIQGKDTNNQSFFLYAVLMGGGKVEMLYNLDNFTFKHPLFTEHGGKYTFPSRVTQNILGPGIVSFENIRGPWNVLIQKFTKISPTRVKIVTSMKDDEGELYAIRRK